MHTINGIQKALISRSTALTFTDLDRVPFVLFGQALMFYTPYYLWKAWEGNKLRSIIQGLNIFTLKETATERGQKEDILAKYVTNNLHEHNGWAIRYFACEFMNLVCFLIFLLVILKFSIKPLGFNSFLEIYDPGQLKRFKL